MRKLTARALSLQLTVVVMFSLIVISGYSIVNTYNNHINSSQEYVKEKLHAITTTAAHCIPGEQHQYLSNTYKTKDAIQSSEQDSVYHKFHTYLKAVKDSNNLDSDIYTMFMEDDKFYYCLTSGVNPYFRHAYTSYPEELDEKFNVGSTIGPYSDEHDTWLSAFYPIRDKNNKTVAVIQADVKFNQFIMDARKEMMQNIMWSAIIFIVIAVFVLYTVRKLSKLDQEKNDKLQVAYRDLKTTTKDLQDSINYAKHIQWALIPSINEIKQYLPQSFMFYEPKDVVSGDFPWYFLKDNYIYLAAVDCTGHGVPGAMMSVIGHLLMNDIVNNEKICTPGELLTQLHESVVRTLKQEEERGINDGMDLALCRINLSTNEVMYSGAHRPLYLFRNGEVEQFRGNSFPIGSTHYRKRKPFQDHVVDVQVNDEIYFFSDGLPDQFGEDGNRKFGPKRIRKIIKEKESFDTMEATFRTAYLEWKSTTDQLDDILMIGVKF